MHDDARLRERRLLEQAREGDELAFDALVAPLREQIYWRAAKAVGDLDEAEDVTQETLLRAFTRLDTFRGDSAFSSWLYQVGTNCIRMHLRSRRRKGAYRLDDHEREAENSIEQGTVLTTPRTPDVLAIEGELVDALTDAISQLPPQYGSILRLWVEDGLDLKQIQERSGLSIAAIKSRLHRARRRVKQFIEAEYGEGSLLAA
jgi:RNA polymerase sigma-70 factor (ECF subfamily)